MGIGIIPKTLPNRDRTPPPSTAMTSLLSPSSQSASMPTQNKPSTPTMGLRIGSLFIGLGLVSAIALGSAGLANRSAQRQINKTTSSQQQAIAASQKQQRQAYIDARNSEIQFLAQLSLLSHRKIWASLNPSEQQQALAQYTQGLDAYSAIAILDQQGQLSHAIRGSRDQAQSVLNLPSMQQAIQQAKAKTSGLDQQSRTQQSRAQQSSSLDNATGILHIAAPIRDAETATVIGSVIAVVPQNTLEQTFQNLASNEAATEQANALTFQIQRTLFMALAFGLPAASLCLMALICFHHDSLRQSLQLTSLTLGKLGGRQDIYR